MVNALEVIANENLNSRFIDNPCRGIVLGMNEDKELIQLSWIMGRSDNSKNRVYIITKENDTVKTEPADPSKVKDPRLIIYNAMRNFENKLIVSNGNQTDTVYDMLNVTKGEIGSNLAFYVALISHYCEPDPIIFTPRISGYQILSSPNIIYMSILKADPFSRERWIKTVEQSGLKREDFEDNDKYNEAIGKICGLDHRAFPTQRQFFELPAKLRYGYCLTTYKPGSKTLPSFEGEPFVVPIKGRVEDVMQTFWNALEPEWKVALAGKIAYGGTTHVPEPINRFEKAGGE